MVLERVAAGQAFGQAWTAVAPALVARPATPSGEGGVRAGSGVAAALRRASRSWSSSCSSCIQPLQGFIGVRVASPRPNFFTLAVGLWSSVCRPLAVQPGSVAGDRRSACWGVASLLIAALAA